MTGPPLHIDTDVPPLPDYTIPSTGPVAEQLIRWVLLLAFAVLTGLIVILGALIAVYAGSVLPTTFGTVLLRWVLTLIAIAASPNIAGWIVRKIVHVIGRNHEG